MAESLPTKILPAFANVIDTIAVSVVPVAFAEASLEASLEAASLEASPDAASLEASADAVSVVAVATVVASLEASLEALSEAFLHRSGDQTEHPCFLHR